MTRPSPHFWLAFLLCVSLSLTLANNAYATEYTIGGAGDYATIALGIEAASAGDTLTLLAGKHTTGANTIDGLTIRGVTGEAADVTVINSSATAQILKVTSGTAYLRDFTCRTTGVPFTGAGGFFVYANGGSIVLNNVAFRSVNGTGGSASHVAVYTNGATSVRLINCAVDSCSTPMANIGSIVRLAETGDSVVNGCTFSNNVSAVATLDIYQTAAKDTAKVTGCLFVNNRATNTGAAMAFRPHLGTAHKDVNYCTFVGNECADVSDGQALLTTETNNLTHCIFASGDSTYAISDTDGPTVADHCDSWGNVQDHLYAGGWGTGDTLHIDPAFNSTTGPYAPHYTATAAGCATATDDSYMGWLEYAPTVATLSLTVTDAATGDTLPARMRVIDSADLSCYPAAAIWHSADATGTITWPEHWYTDGTDDVTVNVGDVVVSVSAGPEYYAKVETVAVSGATAHGTALTRRADMNALGWYSFDNHIHLSHDNIVYHLTPIDGIELAESEGLNVINCMDLYLSGTDYFTGLLDTNSTASTLLWISEEQRHRKWGHMEAVGTSAKVDSVRYTTVWHPMLYTHADTVHALGGMYVPAHIHSQKSLNQLDGNERAKELPVMLWKDKVDAVSIASYSSVSTGGRDLEYWYDLLNCGFQVPLSVGTDAVADRSTGGAPMGGLRAYTYLGATPLTYDAWKTAVRSGNSFATSGPLFTHFTFGGRTAGSTLAQRTWHTETYSGTFTVKNTTPLKRAYVIVNGAVDQSFAFSGADSMTQSFNVTLTEPSWVAVKVMGDKAEWSTVCDSLFAHTGPVYVTMAAVAHVDSTACEFFSDWLDTLSTLIADEGVWKAPGDSATVAAVLDSANAYFSGLYATYGDPGTDTDQMSGHRRDSSRRRR